MRCSGAVLLRVGRNGGRYCTRRSTLLPAGPAWCTAWGIRALHQRGLAVRRRDCMAAGCRRASDRKSDFVPKDQYCPCSLHPLQGQNKTLPSDPRTDEIAGRVMASHGAWQ
eukprot:COSAG06_NODE_95_length_24425_cov_882.571035_21_plen_111_part_00